MAVQVSAGGVSPHNDADVKQEGFRQGMCWVLKLEGITDATFRSSMAPHFSYKIFQQTECPAYEKRAIIDVRNEAPCGPPCRVRGRWVASLATNLWGRKARGTKAVTTGWLLQGYSVLQAYPDKGTTQVATDSAV